MARLILALLAISVTSCLISIIQAASQDNLVGKAFFLEGRKQEYLRRTFAEGNAEEEVISGEETAAAIAVLLGVPPPITLSSDSSARLDSLLLPNPFKRPHAVAALTIRGIISDSPIIKETEEIFGSSIISKQRLISANAFQRPQELPGREVSLHSLNYGEYTPNLKEGLKDLGSFLGGIWDNEEESDKVLLSIPLPLANGFAVSIDLAERADRQFARELLSLFHATQFAPRLQDVQTQAKLFLATFSALELMKEESQHRHDATRLFLHTAARVLNILEAQYNGQMVGVVTLLSTSGTQVPAFSVMESRSSRSLQESLAPSPSQAPSNQTLYDAEIKKLLSRSLLVVTTLILLIATGLGSCFLFFMPLTRDTLLYANVKLD